MNAGGPGQQRSLGLGNGCIHNMSVPPRTQVLLEVRPVFGAVLVSLAQCLRLKGVIDKRQAYGLTACFDLAGAALRWAGRWSANSFWRKVEPLGCTPAAVEAAARDFGGARIGWAREVYPEVPNTLLDFPAHDRVCTDLCLTVAILSRRAGNLFLSAREPEYSPQQLFAWAFAADDPYLAARSISWEQWPQKGCPKPDTEQCPLRFHPRPDWPGLKTLNL